MIIWLFYKMKISHTTNKNIRERLTVLFFPLVSISICLTSVDSEMFQIFWNEKESFVK